MEWNCITYLILLKFIDSYFKLIVLWGLRKNKHNMEELSPQIICHVHFRASQYEILQYEKCVCVCVLVLYNRSVMVLQTTDILALSLWLDWFFFSLILMISGNGRNKKKTVLTVDVLFELLRYVGVLKKKNNNILRVRSLKNK